MCGYHLQYDSLTATIPNKPKKTVDKTVANTGDTVTYTVTQNISKALDKNFYYSSLVFKDVLNSNLSYISLNVYDENEPGNQDADLHGTIILCKHYHLSISPVVSISGLSHCVSET